MNFGCAKTHRIIEIDALMAHLGTSWGPLETPWNHLGDPWGLLGTILGPLGTPLGAPWSHLGASWSPLGRSWGSLGKATFGCAKTHRIIEIDALRDRYLRGVRFANLIFFE